MSDAIPRSAGKPVRFKGMSVFDLAGGKIAAYRDDKGSLHCVSPVCTHLGCQLNWNSGDRSWDCPCHGSRFSPSGEILQGPAVKPLERR